MARQRTATTKTEPLKRKPSKRKPAAGKPLTCFVVIGFGRKADPSTGRVLDLDLTYEALIRPAFDRFDINCFRAIEANTTGSIDSLMYKWIFEADFVVADLSTLNANVFYELGVRHAQKPETTIVIAESVLMTKIPFDLSSFVIHSYEHGGDKIAAEERKRFVDHLAAVVKEILPVKSQANDSPVYTFLPGIPVPDYAVANLTPPTYVPPGERAAAKPGESKSLADMLKAAEAAKKEERFEDAIQILEKAIGDQEKPDISLPQRLALVTYKAGEKKDDQGNVDKDAAVAALSKAESILEKYCAPSISNDPETLGLSGAINKRLYDRTGNTRYLDSAIHYYERGFYVKQDYYNGINVAFMHTMKANMEKDRFQAIVYYGHANLIRQRVVEICHQQIKSAGFGKFSDDEKMWLYLSLAEAYQGIGGMEDEIDTLMPRIQAVWDKFGQTTFEEQKMKLQEAIDKFNARVQPETLTSSPAASDVGAASAHHPGAIVVDANIGRKIKSVKVKIEYDD